MLKFAAVIACSFFGFFAFQTPANAQHPGADPALTDAEQLMLYERTIYTRRGLGDMGYYASLMHPNYTGWPPMMDRPMSPKTLAKSATEGASERLLGEEIDFYPMDVVFAGDMAMTYFVGHRIVKGGTLEPSDEYFDNIHVWVKEDDGVWYLMGGMARSMPPEKRVYLLTE